MIKPRKTPCASCPYRCDVPSGVWSASEYGKLETYDGDTSEQAMKGALGVFACHQGKAEICAGWAAVHGNRDNFALRMAHLMDPHVDVGAVIEYTTDVPVFASGKQAADHGRREIEQPGSAAREAVGKIARVRRMRGQPVTYSGSSQTGRGK